MKAYRSSPTGSFFRKPLATAVSTAVGLLGSAALVTSMETQAQIEEVVVTATRKSESAQDIPITIQALSEDTLDDLGIGNFKDYIKNLAGVTSGGRGPGRNEIFIRGVSAGKGGLKVAGAVGLERQRLANVLVLRLVEADVVGVCGVLLQPLDQSTQRLCRAIVEQVALVKGAAAHVWWDVEAAPRLHDEREQDGEDERGCGTDQPMLRHRLFCNLRVELAAQV